MEIIPDSASYALAEGLSQQLLPSLNALEKQLSYFEWVYCSTFLPCLECILICRYRSQQKELLASFQKATDSSITEPDLTNVKETV
jgi:hypothetical protein